MSESSTSPAPRVAAIVLAAGLSSRFGALKALATLHGRMLLDHVLDALITSKAVDPIIVVTGHRADEITVSLHRWPVVIAHNADYAAGEMLSSIKTGVRALGPEVDAAVLCLVDQPMVRARTIEALTAEWGARPARVILPTFRNKRGHPIVLSASGFAEILSLAANATLKDYTSAYQADTVELAVDDPAVVRDIDTPADLAAEQERSSPCTEPI